MNPFDHWTPNIVADTYTCDVCGAVVTTTQITDVGADVASLLHHHEEP